MTWFCTDYCQIWKTSSIQAIWGHLWGKGGDYCDRPSYLTMPYHITSIPYHTMPNHTLPYHSISYHAKPYLTNGKLPCHNISYHATPYLTMPYHTIALLWPPTASGLKPAHFPSCQSPIVPIPVPFHLYQPAISIPIPSIYISQPNISRLQLSGW